MMEFEDQAEDHDEEEEEEEEEESEDDDDDDDIELFPDSTHTHPSNYPNNSNSNSSVISPTPLALKMSNNLETPPLITSLKTHHTRTGSHSTSSSTAKYKECLKNHAVGIGGHAVDGCGEFMPGGPDGSLDALKCAACNCHRNFHRKEFFTDVSPLDKHTTTTTTPLYPLPPHQHHIHPHIVHHHPPPPVFQFYPYNRTPGPATGGFLQLPAPPSQRPAAALPPPPPLSQSHPQQLALPSTTTTATSSGDGEEVGGMISPGSSGGMMMMMSSSKKRFRTKFTSEQKERMLELAERMGWRLQKQDEGMIQRFCEENGVKRQVLKVWMHNNKNTLGSISSSGGGGGYGGGGIGSGGGDGGGGGVDSSGGGKKP